MALLVAAGWALVLYWILLHWDLQALQSTLLIVPALGLAALVLALLFWCLLYYLCGWRHSRTPLKTTLRVASAFLVGALITGALVIHENRNELRLKRADAQTIAGGYANSLEYQLARIEHAVGMLGSWLQGGGDPAQFEQQARQLLTRFSAIENLQLAPAGVVRQIVPLSGHEAALGHDLFADPVRRADAISTRDGRVSRLVGPFGLRQGGKGVVVRSPVFVGTEYDHFWGFANALFRLEQVLRLSGFDRLGEHYDWQLSASSGDSIAATGALDDPDAVTAIVSFSSGVWRLDIAPHDGWFSASMLITDATLGTTLLAAFVLLVMLMQQHSSMLHAEVEGQTRHLRKVQQSLRQNNWLLDQTQRLSKTGSWKLDLPTQQLEWSDETYRIFGASRRTKERYALFQEAIHPHDRARVERAWQQGLERGHFEVEHRILVAGRVRWVREIAEFHHDDSGTAVRAFGAVRDVTALKVAQLQMQQNQERLELALSAAKLGAWDYEVQAERLRVDERWAEMLGLQLDHLQPRLSTWLNRVHPSEQAQVNAALEAHLSGSSELFSADFRMAHQQGGWVWINSIGKVTRRNGAGEALRMSGVNLDISTRKRRELELRTLYKALDKSPAATLVTSIEPRIIYANRAFTELSGYRLDEVAGLNPRVLRSGRTPPETYTELWQTITAGEVWEGEFWNRHKSGELRLERVSVAPVTDDSGEIVNFIATKEDITQRKQRELQIWRQASFDALTQLANRWFFVQSLEEALHRARRSQQRVAVLFIDLDKFKPVNDSYGHEAGDSLLQAFAQRLRELLRDSDIIGRLGGDEFAVVIEGLDAPLQRGFVAEKLEQPLTQPYPLSTEQRGAAAPLEVTIGASIGVAHYPDDGNTPDQLLSAADADMYRVKALHQR